MEMRAYTVYKHLCPKMLGFTFSRQFVSIFLVLVTCILTKFGILNNKCCKSKNVFGEKVIK